MNGGAEPYSVPVIKEECINHVSKRLGTHLRNLKNNMRVATKTKTGKMHLVSLLKLTDKHIDLLDKYFGQNIHYIPNATLEVA